MGAALADGGVNKQAQPYRKGLSHFQIANAAGPPINCKSQTPEGAAMRRFDAYKSNATCWDPPSSVNCVAKQMSNTNYMTTHGHWGSTSMAIMAV